MNAFFITISLVLATAAAEYNYQQPGDQRVILQDALRIPQVNFQGNNLQQQFVPQIQHILQGPQVQLQAPHFQGQQQQFNYQAGPLGPIVTKDIYVHAAPEEPEERYQAPPQPIQPPRKHYRIVFIKAPTPKVSSTLLKLQQAKVEEKTIIYVLSKKPEPLDLQTVLQDAPRQPSKPEVYFIKYKTQEEAAHAQRTIQAQFDSLGGTSSISDEGVAPITSVIGALQNQQQPNIIASGSNGVGSNYLPPNK